ncbi:Mu transposase C-terminal domain-containing protein [Rhodocyclus tenuis]|uniref:Putative transposase n=1 Tax=Rhodocyclus tenuis TaxID=1066 RepID=A0A840G3F7_RHOTE|nr:Mu transposase C-terminal domain-containing protein [Rhodocyclus tenuis]MBB4245841.1 putative transposase [Rhodocyclus tenuis]
MRFSFVAGLALRHGTRTIELVRELSDDEYQFEDVETRRPQTLRKYQLLKDIEAGKYSVVFPALAKGASGTVIDAYESSSLPEHVQTEIDRRYAYVMGMAKLGITRGNRKLVPKAIERVAAFIKDKKPPAPSTVLAWARRYENSNKSARALASRNYGRRSPKRMHSVMHALILEKIRAEYLTEDRKSLEHTSIVINAEARKLAAQGKLDIDQAKVSKSTVARYVQDLDRYEVIARRYGLARARMLCRTPMRDDYPQYPFERVEVDHTPFDWVVICDRTGIPLGRPLLTAAICATTGYPAGMYLSFYGPGVTSISGVLRATIQLKDEVCRIAGTKQRWLAAGIPDGLQLDNGLEFHAMAFRRMARDIGMDLYYSRVRTPWSKPHIERFMADLGFLTLSGGRIRKRLANVIDADPRTTATITFSNLVIGLIRYMVDVYPMRINDRKLARPYDLMLEGIERCPPANYLADSNLLRLTTALSKKLTVNQGGVELHGTPYGGAELLPMRKAIGKSFKTEVRWDPDDINQIWVQHPITSDWVVCASRWPQYTAGLSWNQHLLIRKFMRQELKLKGAEEDYRRAYIALHEFWMDVSQKSSADAKLAARFSGVTSARVFNQAQPPTPVPLPIPIPSDDGNAATVVPRTPPEFDAFIFELTNG